MSIKYLQINHKKKAIGGVQYYMKTLSNEFQVETINITNWTNFFLFVIDLLKYKNTNVISHSLKYSLFLSLILKNHYLVIHDNFHAIKSNYFFYYKFIVKSRLNLIVFTDADRHNFESDSWNVNQNNFCVPIKSSSSEYKPDLNQQLTMLYYGRISNSQKCCDELLTFATRSGLDFIFIGPFGDIKSKNSYSNFYQGTVNSLEDLLLKIKNKKVIGISFSDHEGMPISMFELLELGIPFVSTDCADSISYFFNKFKIGEVIDKKNFENVKSKINLINNEYESYSKNCKKLNINKIWKDSWQKLLH